jgi:hypothetical protein
LRELFFRIKKPDGASPSGLIAMLNMAWINGRDLVPFSINAQMRLFQVAFANAADTNSVALQLHAMPSFQECQQLMKIFFKCYAALLCCSNYSVGGT